jgi:hypothetical protein
VFQFQLTTCQIKKEIFLKQLIQKDCALLRTVNDEELGYMKNSLKTDEQRASFLQQGISQMTLRNIVDPRKMLTITMAGAYPNGTTKPIVNDLQKRTKNDILFGYPRK